MSEKSYVLFIQYPLVPSRDFVARSAASGSKTSQIASLTKLFYSETHDFVLR